MFVPVDTLPADSRIWIYQSTRAFTGEEKKYLESILADFCSEWVAHGNPIRSSFEIRFDHFIILYADENYNATSGCSIDSSVRVIKEISQKTGIDLFQRTTIAFLTDGGVSLYKTTDLKDFFEKGMWDDQTITFNNLIQSKDELQTSWLVPAGNTWLKRYLDTRAVKS